MSPRDRSTLRSLEAYPNSFGILLAWFSCRYLQIIPVFVCQHPCSLIVTLVLLLSIGFLPAEGNWPTNLWKKDKQRRAKACLIHAMINNLMFKNSILFGPIPALKIPWNWQFWQSEQSREKSAYTAQGKVRALKAFASWLFTEGYANDNLLSYLKLPELETILSARWLMMRSTGWSATGIR